MYPHLDCGTCILKWVYERAGILASEKEQFQLFRRISGILAKEFHPKINVGALSNVITGSIHEYLRRSANYYERLKLKSNQHVHELLPPAKKYIEKGRNPRERLKRACCLASASNIAPMSVPGRPFAFEEATRILKGRGTLPAFLGDVFETLRRATRILYLTDNAGEIGFDSLLIRILRDLGVKVNLVVKEDPFFEDATKQDALLFSMDKHVENIFTVHGFFIPGKSPSQLAAIFKKSDLLIVKGTGNYEALKGELRGKNAIFMLKVKCAPIATEVGVPPGTFVVKAETSLL